MTCPGTEPGRRRRDRRRRLERNLHDGAQQRLLSDRHGS
jgi:hypothetical protein